MYIPHIEASTRLAVLAVTVMWGAACGTAPVEPTNEANEEFRDSDGRPSGCCGWIGNGLVHPEVEVMDPGYALTSVQGVDPDDLDTTNKEKTVEYAIECALDPAQSVTKTIDGEDVEFVGALGLAPQWRDGACDEDCQQWVSACLLARTNVTGLAGVSVLLWIDDPWDDEDDPPSTYDYEAAYFGNLWDDGEGYLCQDVSGLLTSVTAARVCNPTTGCPIPSSNRYTDCHSEGRCTDESGTPHSHDCKKGSTPSGSSYNTLNVYIKSSVVSLIALLLGL